MFTARRCEDFLALVEPAMCCACCLSKGGFPFTGRACASRVLNYTLALQIVQGAAAAGNGRQAAAAQGRHLLQSGSNSLDLTQVSHFQQPTSDTTGTLP